VKQEYLTGTDAASDPAEARRLIYTLRYDDATIVWDITKALELITFSCAAVVEMPAEEMEQTLHIVKHSAARFNEVDHSIPGIGAPLYDNGVLVMRLIDGTHRCGKAWHLGHQFWVRVLRREASRACILECGDWRLIP
jgi:hypothetical protein